MPQAFKAATAVSYAAAALAAVSAVFTTAALGMGMHWRTAQLLTKCVVFAVSIFIAAWARSFKQKLIFVDYVHSDHH